MTAGRGTRLGAYALLGVLAVCAFLWFSAGVEQRQAASGERSLERSRLASTPHPVVDARDGAIVPSSVDVRASSGAVYQASGADVSSSGVVSVSITVRAPDGDGTVSVSPPEVVLLVDGDRHRAWRKSEDSIRTTGGGYVGFTTSFDDAVVEVGDEIAVELVLPDDGTVQFRGIKVLDDHFGSR